MNTVIEYQNLMVLLFCIVFFANFCGLGLWIFLAVHLYTKLVREVRREELEFQITKKNEAIQALKELGAKRSLDDDDDFSTSGKGFSA